MNLSLIPQAIQAALEHHQAGRLPQAEAIFQQILLVEPNHPDALHFLGVIAFQGGKKDVAVKLISKAINANPTSLMHYNLGLMLKAQGRLDEAVESYRKALSLKPDYAEAHNNIGNVLKDQGKLDEAIQHYRQAILINPNDAVAYSSLGSVLKDQNRLDEALANYRLALNAKRDWKESLYRLTTPLVVTTGMVLDSPKTASLADASKQANTLPEQAACPITPIVPLAALRELPVGESMHPEPGVRKKLRIILIYPPPWQIPLPGETIIGGMPFGPSRDSNDHHFDGDFRTITYGVLTLAAQAKRAGYDVSVYNLSTCPWRDVAALIAENKADVYGISAFTANRRGMGAVAALVRQQYPQAHIMVGGPFVTALPQDTLRYYRDIDTAVIGEGEDTFMELLECLSCGRPTAGIAGTAWRNGEDIALGPTRPRIKNLDALASPFDYFTSSIVMTSRGCPSKCTFCGTFATWGKMLHMQTAESCLDTFKKALARLPVPFIMVKDDTFTAHRRRTFAICDSIIENNINFIWSCDTRVDCLDDERLHKMRLAGCQTVSFGVESGSPEMLKTMRKDTTPEMILEATRSARKYGMQVRYYMILILRGETPETIQQSIDLIKAGRPDLYMFGSLMFFPGTEDWATLREKQGLTPDIFFRNDFRELGVATGRRKEVQDVLLHVMCDIGAIYGFNYTVEEREAVVVRLPHLHSAYVELANAYFRAGRLDDATSALNRAEELGFPIGNIIYNQRACIALARSEVNNALTLLERASQSYPNQIIMKNLKNLRTWAGVPANNRDKPPVLDDSIWAIDFQSHLQTNRASPKVL